MIRDGLYFSVNVVRASISVSPSVLDSNEVSAVWHRRSLQCFLLCHCGNCRLLAHLLQG